MQCNQLEYFGSLHFDEEDFLLKIIALLQDSVGRPIAEIGSLDIP
jgi:hypothetical protein